MSSNPEKSQHLIRSILLNIIASAVFAIIYYFLQSPITLVVMVVVCVAIIVFPAVRDRLWNGMRHLIHARWILVCICVFVLICVAVLLIGAYMSVPRDVIAARKAVKEIEKELGKGGLTIAWTEPSERERERLFMRGYQVLKSDHVPVPDGPIRTYVRGGKIIADDFEEDGGFARRYYLDECNFATDHLDRAYRWKSLELGKCADESSAEPVFLPPSPGLSY